MTPVNQTALPGQEAANPPDMADQWPELYEDDEEGDMGDSNPHTLTIAILLFGLKAHLAPVVHFQVFANLNLYYHPTKPRAYVSPDLMAVEPFVLLPEEISSYRVGEQGPAPVLTIEVLSERTAQQRDLKEKLRVYALLRIPEYILVDVTSRYLPQRLLLKRLQPDGTWLDEQDADGGITSRLGFRVILEADGRVRVVDAATGKRYARPEEAQAAVDQLTITQQRIQTLEAELERLRGASPKEEPQAKKGKGRRRKS